MTASVCRKALNEPPPAIGCTLSGSIAGWNASVYFAALACRWRGMQKLLADDAAPSVKILEKRLGDLEGQMIHLGGQQHFIISMLKTITGGSYAPVLDKKMWVDMLAA